VAKGNNLPLALALVLALVPRVVLADEPTVPTTPPETQPSAEAQPSVSRADALFQEGKQLLDEGKFIEACDKLAQSDALDPAIGTLGLLAACHEQQGRVATAWREYGETAARAEAVGDERAAFARDRAKALEPELPRLLVRLARKSANVTIFRNGIRLMPDDIGIVVPVDPGTYEIVARWPDKPEFRATLIATSRKVAELEVPDPEKQAAATSIRPPDRADKPAVKTGISPRGIGAIVAGGVGLVGFGVSTAFAISAASKNAASVPIEQTCTLQAECQRGKDLRQQAFAAATVANVGFGVGVVGAGTALVLALLPNRTPKTSSGEKTQARLVQFVPWAGRDVAGAQFIGRF